METVEMPLEILKQHGLPPRTVLASLAPIGLGTAYVESLSSYFQRLAAWHNVSPKALARTHVLPELGFNKRIGEEQADRFWRTSFFNGMGEVPEAWCRILEGLTGVAGLRRLTLLPLHGRVSLRGCASAEKRWCPHCLHEAEASGEAYGQLLWEIGWVKACPKHGVPLESSHGCSPEDAILPLQVKHLPHVCERCARSLCRPVEGGVTTAASEDTEFARLIGDLLAGPLFAADPVPLGRSIGDFLKDVLTIQEHGSGRVVVSKLGVSKSDLSGWVHRKHLPALPQALRIAETYRTPLSSVLVGEGGSYMYLAEFYNRGPKPISYRPSRIGGIYGFTGDMVPHLRKFLEQPDPPSVAEAAFRLQTSSRSLRKQHPELAHLLAEKHAAWKAQEASRRREERMQVVRAMVDQLVCEGLVPTMRRLEERLVGIPKSFLFQERVACKRLCELGKERRGV